VSTEVRQQNARANRDAAAWDRRNARRLRRQERDRHPPPAPKAPRLPRWAGAGRPEPRGYGDRGGPALLGRGGVAKAERTEEGT
jgi:hypothetical protein